MIVFSGIITILVGLIIWCLIILRRVNKVHDELREQRIKKRIDETKTWDRSSQTWPNGE